jgi:hypothetical protein
VFSRAAVFAGDDWRPIDPADLALKTPKVEKDADAEAIFWEVRVDDSIYEELSLRNYVRIKVFTERGRESQSKVDLQYIGSNRIKDIAARVIKADGTIIELKKEDIFERTIVKVSGGKAKAKSFALPGVEPGCIVEYRWREVRPYASADRLRLQFQREIPTETVTYFLKPYTGMRYMPFHIGETRFVKDKDGFSKLTLSNVPAFREEPYMPPEDEVRSWVFLYYTDAETKLDPDKYWNNLGKSFYDTFKDYMKPNDDVKAAVAGIVGDAATPEEKLQRIYDFCRTKIKNIDDDANGMTEDEKRKFKDNKSAGNTLKRGMGTSMDVDMLFGALAKAAGFDARLALSGNRDDVFFNRDLANIEFLGSSFIAVKLGEQWQFYMPEQSYTTPGMLTWPAESQDVLITDPKQPIWTKTGTSEPEKSLEKRTAKFRLLEDGTLEGEARAEYSGHLGDDMKEYNDDDSPTQREETLRATIKKRMSTAEISDIKIENVTDPIKPFVYTYHIRVPGYAQRTGKRIFLQPAFFEHGVDPVFPASDRKHPVYFHYPWLEQDEVTIELPAGYSLDNADAPSPIRSAPVAEYTPTIGVTVDKKTLVYKRKFFFGGGGNIFFPTSIYPGLKTLFDAVHKGDNHTITLKQTAATAATN